MLSKKVFIRAKLLPATGTRDPQWSVLRVAVNTLNRSFLLGQSMGVAPAKGISKDALFILTFGAFSVFFLISGEYLFES
jgi:hypothetical protein